VVMGVVEAPHQVQKYVSEGKQRSLVLLHQAIRGLEEAIADETRSSAPTEGAWLARTVDIR
jgi:hypothetical protein